VAWAIEYYNEAFFHYGETLREQGYDNTPSPKRRSFWQLVPPGRYAPDDARGYLEGYLKSLEATLQEVIGRNSLA
jgi:hypothetical protein